MTWKKIWNSRRPTSILEYAAAPGWMENNERNFRFPTSDPISKLGIGIS